MRKVYKINGKTEVHEVFTSPSGKTKIKVAFTKGNLDPNNRVPARFTTDSPIVQAFIENSPKFNKTIFLEKVFADKVQVPAAIPARPGKGKGPVKNTGPEQPQNPTPPSEQAEVPIEGEAAAEEKVYPEVTKTGDAVSILMKAGAKIKQVSDYEGIMKVAKAKGISFPNLVKED